MTFPVLGVDEDLDASQDISTATKSRGYDYTLVRFLLEMQKDISKDSTQSDGNPASILLALHTMTKVG